MCRSLRSSPRPSIGGPHAKERTKCSLRSLLRIRALMLQLSGTCASEPFGHFRDVHHEFPRAHGEPLVAITAVSFDLKVGTLVTLLGPSGCGKTTFLKIVGGLIRATSGTVRINDRDVTEPQPDFGIAFQQSNLMPWRSVLKNVLFPMEIRHESGQAARDRAMELLAVVGLQGFETAYPAQLSGG